MTFFEIGWYVNWYIRIQRMNPTTLRWQLDRPTHAIERC